MPKGYPGDGFLWEVCQELEHHFGIKHSTIQVETGDSAYPCALEPEHLV
jgi:cobalt-zinc-cadmium efflux system protein